MRADCSPEPRSIAWLPDSARGVEVLLLQMSIREKHDIECLSADVTVDHIE